MKDNAYAQAEMLIRKPVNEVFEAFINPDITTQFWFTKGTRILEEGVELEWIWEMYNLTVPVFVKKLNLNEKIIIEWGEGEDKSVAEWNFKPIGTDKTFVSIYNYDFKGTGDHLISQIRDSTGGFTMVLAGLKAYLEHGIQLNLVRDRLPQELMDS